MKKTKITAATIASILILTMSAIFVALPTVNAVDVETYAFLNVAPNPVGVGQTTTIGFWLSVVPPTAAGPAGDRWTFTAEVTKPDGSKETLGLFTSDAVGSAYTFYTPNQVGIYTFQMSFPGQRIEGQTPAFGSISRYVNNTYLSSNSPKVELIVQEDQIESWPAVELPADYWDRPINAENREWWSISGNWLMASCDSSVTSPAGRHAFNPYTTAPNTGHIVWTKPIAFGGIVGGEMGSKQYYTGLSYEFKLRPPIIMQGRLYYNTPDPPVCGFVCVDLRTGKELWQQSVTPEEPEAGISIKWTYPGLTLGQLLDVGTPNQYGVIPYLWETGSTYKMYDAFTGNWILSLENATTGVNVLSEKGDFLVYILDGKNNWLAMWNSTKAIDTIRKGPGWVKWLWRVPQGTFDWNDGIQWNITVPDVPGVQVTGRYSNTRDILLAESDIYTTEPPTFVNIAYDMKTGEQMWVQNRTDIGDQSEFGCFTLSSWLRDEIYTIWVKETMQYHGYNASTGEELWVTEPRKNAFGMYYGPSVMAYGKYYAANFDGRVNCYDLKTGTLLWEYYVGDAGLETPYGHWPFYNGMTAADGKIYIGTGEHSPSSPTWRGWKLHCINAETGEGVWNISGYIINPIIADSYLVAYNGYDNQIYCFGKGQTAITVTGPEAVQPLGTPILIKGTVTDQSPGAKDTPAISDEDMSAWMEYLYMQKPMPKDAAGVKVHLTAIDPNGNYQDIGEVTADLNGNFGKMWTPPVPGEYHITATFEGSESYWSSDATTYMGVTEAPSPAQPIEPEQPAHSEQPTEPSEAPFITTTDLVIIAAVAVAVVIGIAVHWTLRKRK